MSKLALGYSYSIGQSDWAHNAVPNPDIQHPYWPDRSVWVDWLTELAQHDEFGCWVPLGPNQYNTWHEASIQEIEQYLLNHSGGDPNSVGSFTPLVGDVLRGIFRVFQVDGSLRTDIKTANDASTFAFSDWDPADGISNELHIYYFEYNWNGHTLKDMDAFNDAITNSGIRLQILGMATSGDNKDKLLLPHAKGVDIEVYRHDSGNNWIHDIGISEWTKVHWSQIEIAISAVVAVIVTVVSWGTATAAVVTAEIEFIRYVVSAAEVLIYAALTGDTSNVLKKLGDISKNIVEAQIKAHTGDIDAAKIVDDFKVNNPDIYNTISKCGSTLAGVYQKATDIYQSISATYQKIDTGYEALEVDVNSIIQATNTLGVTNTTYITGDIWDSVKSHIPPVATFWYDKIRQLDPTDVNLNNILIDIENRAPEYAKGAIHTAVTLKAVESMHIINGPVFKTQQSVKIDRPGGGNAGDAFATDITHYSKGIQSILSPTLGFTHITY